MVPLALPASSRLPALLHEADQVRSGNPVRFNQLLEQIAPLEGEASTQQREKIAYLHAYAHSYAGRCDEGVRESEQIIAESRDPDIRSRASALIVNCFASSRKFLQGLRELDRLSLLTSKAKLDETRQHSLFASANLYNQVGQYRLGLRDINKLLSTSGEILPRNRCFAEQLKLELQERLGELPSDEAPVKKSVELCLSLSEPMVANFARLVIANQRVAAGNRAGAENILRENLPQIEATKYPRLISQTKALLSELLFADGNFAAAEDFALQAITAGTVDRSVLPQVNANKVLYQIAEKRGQVVEAFKYYRAFAEADKAYLNEVKTRELAYQIVRQENQQKNQQIELLNRKNNLLQLQQQVDQQSAQNSRLYMLLFALLTVSLGFWAYKTKRMQLSVKRMAETDALTGICNRHHYTSLAEKTLARCKAAGEPVSLLMFDLDYFKSINDNYGHVTGDWVLKRVAEVCTGLCRGIDHLGRIGGEEFAILLHGCDLKAATRMAEDCRVRLSSIDPLPSGYTFPISASFGVSSSTTSGYDLDKLLSHADQMLYRAKREGRNRVRAFVADVSVELTGTHFGKVPTADSASVADPLRA
jgi:diguanylate cyclase (GGDEF)-like protein